jgi:hypothetical protein
MKLSNRFLALIVIMAIALSGFSTFTLLNKLSQLPAQEITGKAGSSGIGRVNFTVASSVSITLTNNAIDFGTGYVNSSKCATNATLNAGQSYNDSDGPINTCWIQTVGSAQPTSFLIENDGNVNIILKVTGPDQRNFLNYTGSYPNNLTWRARNSEPGACAGGTGTFQQLYTSFNGVQKDACTNMTYQPSGNDELAIDIQLIIPSDIKPGEYKNSSIEFTAVQS